MTIVEPLLISVGLSMDAFAVAVSKGLGMRRRDDAQAIAIAVTFGVFQGGMALLGWLLGSRLLAYISAVDHWIAFGLLSVVGGRMLFEAVRGDPEGEPAPDVRLSVRELLVLAVATSIDALAAGIGLALVDFDLWSLIGLIAAVTCGLSFVGVVVGHRFGLRFERPAEIAGGVILILIGLRILLEHLGLIAF